jgi:hypothetical protein
MPSHRDCLSHTTGLLEEKLGVKTKVKIDISWCCYKVCLSHNNHVKVHPGSIFTSSPQVMIMCGSQCHILVHNPPGYAHAIEAI